MCAINGILSRSVVHEAELRAGIESMNAATAHRGPDGAGIFLRPGVALGHRRLSILDLSVAGAQPMRSADERLTLVFNGEIYNYRELAAELRANGHVFKSHSDSEVILHAYRQWGESCVRRFNGMWAFAIWDEWEGRLFACRDRLGVKPFFYVETPTALRFSSEIAGLQTIQDLREANLGKLHDYLAYGYRTNNGETFFQNVRELRPGHKFFWDLGGGPVQMRRYWCLEEQRISLPPAGDRPQALAELLQDAVKLRFRSDVPIALLQSGGVDSSVICSIVNDQIEAGTLEKLQDVTAFSAVFPGHRFDESSNILALMAVCPRVRPVQLRPHANDLINEFYAYVGAMQEPTGSATSYVHWKLMQEIKEQGIKVVINGQGADEAFAGYGHYLRGYRLLDVLQSNPAGALKEARAIIGGMPGGWSGLFAQTLKATLGRRMASRIRASWLEGSTNVLEPAFRAAHSYYLPDLPMTWSGQNLERHLRGQLHDYGFNQILHYEDQSSMSKGVEIRSPFVDYRIMEFAFSLPSEDKFSGGVTKRILRDAFRARVPSCIIDNEKKIGFGVPFDIWFASGAFQKWVRSLVSSASFRERTVWRADRLSEALMNPESVRRGFPAWRFITAALWMEQFGIRNA